MSWIAHINALPFASLAESAWETSSVAGLAAEAWQNNQLLAVLFVALTAGGMVGVISVLGLVLIYMERKVAAHFQCRLGPMRVGWHGILQSAADGIKLLMKEGIEPTGVDKLLYLGAPAFSIVGALLLLAVVPVSPMMHVLDLDIGVIYISAIGGIGVLGVLIGGWSSNNKWSLIGAMRAGAQIISYEVSLTIALLIVVMFCGSLKLSEIVLSQQEGWWIWRGHIVSVVAFMIFVVASTAELNRTPFDLPEGESELTGGFHTEYTGLRFSFFFLAEFAQLAVFAGLASTFFLGGWMPFHIGGFETFNGLMDLIPPAIWFFGKTLFLIFLLMWFRWTFPRMRMDQLMKLEWKVLLPLGMANLIIGAFVIFKGWYFFA